VISYKATFDIPVVYLSL